MKVLMFLASSLDGGAEKLVADLSNAMAAHGVDVVVAAFRQSQWLVRLDSSVRIVELASSEKRYDVRLYRCLAQLIKEEQPDVVHTHAAKAASTMNIVRKFIDFTHVATKHNSRKGSIFNSLKNVVAVSGAVRDSIHSSIAPKLIPNGVIRKEKPSVDMLPGFNLLAVGRLDPIKRFDCLVSEMLNLPEHVTLSIVGDGPQKEDLERLIDTLKLNGRVQLLGKRSDVAELMASHQSVVISSRTEGFSLVMVEAILYAPMLLSTPVGGVTDLFSDWMYLDPEAMAKKIADAVTNYDQYSQRFSEVSEVLADQLDIRNVAKKYLDLYEGVLNA